MSSKRVLYKAASADEVVQKGKRKSLAQGRLVTKSVVGHGRTPAVEHNATADLGLVTTLRHTSRPDPAENPHLATSPQRREPTQREECSTPRRGMPSLSQHHSPRPARPSESLELSDAESDLIFSPKKSVRGDSSVILVDASGQSHGGADAEVDISLGHAHSPAKVICHAPSVVYANLRDTGDVEQGRRVQVDLLPSIKVLSSGNYTDPNVAHPISTFKSPLVVRESTIAGTCVESHPPGQQEIPKPLLILRDVGPADHPRHRVEPHHGVDSFSESSIESYTERMSEVSEGRCPEDSTLLGAETKGKKKKKGARIIQSRFRQAAAAAATTTRKGPMKATDRRNVPLRFSISACQSMVSKPSSKARPQGVSSASMSQRSGHTPTAQKPSLGNSAQKGGSFKTSTPSADAIKLSACDMSFISPSRHNRHQGLTPELAMNVSKHLAKDISREFQRKMSTGSIDSIKPSSILSTDSECHVTSTHKKVTPEVSQLQLDAHYIQYLQWAFLESRAKKAFKGQEKHIMADLFSLWELTQEQQKRKEDLKHQLQRIRHLNKVDEALDLQQAGMSQVSLGLPTLRAQHQSLATALDTTRHQLPTKGVHIPDDEDRFQDELNAALNESEQLLGELSVMSRQRHPKVLLFADNMAMLKDTTREEVQELAKCQQLLSASQILVSRQCSLQIQDTQLGTDHPPEGAIGSCLRST